MRPFYRSCLCRSSLYGPYPLTNSINCRIDRYTMVVTSSEKVSTSNLPPPAPRNYHMQAPASPSASMRSIPSGIPSTMNLHTDGPFNLQSQQHSYVSSSTSAQIMQPPASLVIHSPSYTDMRQPDDQQATQNANLPRSLSRTNTLRSRESLDGFHIDGTEPRIFPGVVHERTRRKSIKQRSASGADTDGHEGDA